MDLLELISSKNAIFPKPQNNAGFAYRDCTAPPAAVDATYNPQTALQVYPTSYLIVGRAVLHAVLFRRHLYPLIKRPQKKPVETMGVESTNPSVYRTRGAMIGGATARTTAADAV